MHQTLEKFGYPHSLIKDYAHWCVLMRPAQATLGALVLCSKHDATALGNLPPEAYAELQRCTSHIEAALQRFRPYDKINYLALMMIDPQVHFHVLPRYANVQEFAGHLFPDSGWPGVPDLNSATKFDDTAQKSLQAALLDAFAQLV
jgi:diadenosine tetraphosphate (Ap4A) HIT family hydrolase